MKTMRRAFALILTLALVMSLNITAFAAVSNGNIIIAQADKGTTYGAYRLLNLTAADGTNFTYDVNPTYKAFLDTVILRNADYADGKVTVAADALFKVNSANHVVPMYNGAEMDEKDAQTWARLLGSKFKAYLDKNPMKAEKEVAGNASEVQFADMPAGYYYISTNLGTMVSLGSTGADNQPNVTIKEKNFAPTITKQVIENGAPENNNTAASSETLTFVVTVNVKSGAENYILEDTLSANLGDVDPDGVTVEYAAVDTYAAVAAKDWKASYDSASKKLTVKFDNDYLASLDGGKLKVTYTSVLTAGASSDSVINSNVNKAVLKYGHDPLAGTDDPDSDVPGVTLPANPPQQSPEVETNTLYYTLKIQKFTGDVSAATRLTGAGFTLHTAETGSDNQVKLSSSKAGSAVVDHVNGKTDTIMVDDQGVLVINGLDAGEYWLEETVVPAEYNKPAGRTKITITDADLTDGKADIQPMGQVTFGEGDVVTAVGIVNRAGNKLPSTGGIGTTIFYAVGGILMVSALVLLITKKKMASN